MDARTTVRDFISGTFFVEDFGDADSFLQNGIVDSTGMLELVAFIESSFDLRIADAELTPENLDSLDRICAFLEARLAPASPRGMVEPLPPAGLS